MVISLRVCGYRPARVKQDRGRKVCKTDNHGATFWAVGASWLVSKGGQNPSVVGRWDSRSPVLSAVKLPMGLGDLSEITLNQLFTCEEH